MSDALKTLGNLHYANKDYEKALETYSEALGLETDPIKSSRILCNRAAALLHLDRPLEAQEDAYQAVCKDKHYSKGFARLGEAYLKMKQYERAQIAYTRAVKQTSDAAEQSRYESAIEEISRIAKSSPDFDSSCVGSDDKLTTTTGIWNAKVESEKLKGYRVAPGGGIAFLLHALDYCSKGIFALDCGIVVVSKEGCAMMEFSPASNLFAQALLLDPMGAIFPHESPGISPFLKLSELNAIEWNNAKVSKYFEATRWSALDIVADLEKSTGGDEWDRTMSIISNVSSWSIVNSWRKGFKGNFGAAIEDLNLARDLLLEGTKKWGERFSARDEDTFGSKRIRLIEARATELYIDAIVNTEPTSVVSLDALDSIAHSILKNNSRRAWPTNISDVNRLAYFLMPLARAYVALAFTSGRRAAVPYDEVSPGKTATYDLVLAKRAARYYELALKVLPDDYYRKATFVWKTIEQHLRAGGKTAAQIFDLEKQALRLEADRERFFDETYDGTSETARITSVRDVARLRDCPGEAPKDPNRVLAPHVIVNVRDMPSSFDWQSAVKRHVKKLGFTVVHEFNCVVGMSDADREKMKNLRFEDAT